MQENKYILRKQESSKITRTTYFIPCYTKEEFDKALIELPKQTTKLFSSRTTELFDIPNVTLEQWIFNRLYKVDGKEKGKVFRCFQKFAATSANSMLIVHEDAKSSINCLLETSKNPEYGIIYYETINKEEEVTNE